MNSRSGRKMQKLWKAIRYQADYRSLAKNYEKAVDDLQQLYPEFTEQQKETIRAFQTSLLALHEAMVKLALKEK